MAPYTLRTSRHINHRQAANFFPAVRQAEEIGHPLNIFVTINFSYLDCDAQQVSRLFERLRDNHFTRWLRHLRRQRMTTATPTYLWVVENAAGHHHVHWLVHIPSGLEQPFEIKLRSWLRTVAGEIRDDEGALHSKKVDSAQSLTRYLLKGLDRKYAKHFRVRPEPQGAVLGKRCGVSKNLGPTARSIRTRRVAA